MSDLDDSDNELIDPEDIEQIDSDKEDKEDKDDKDNKDDKLKSITNKKLIPEFVDQDEDEDEDEDEDDDDDDDDDDGDDNDVDDEDADDIDIIKNKTKQVLKDSSKQNETLLNFSDTKMNSDNNGLISPINSDVESDDDDYLQKFDLEQRDIYINKFHPECLTANSVEIENLAKITWNKNNIIDENHKTLPFLTKYEKTKILGQRAKQINIGHKPYIEVPSNIIDGYLIAQLELQAKKIPVIIRRPLPGGKSEYWKLSDLEIL